MGSGVAEKLGLDIERIAVWADLSLEALFDGTSEANYSGLPVLSEMPSSRRLRASRHWL